MTLLTLVRHGTTEWIEQGRLHGSLDSPLSEKGRREAHRAAEALKGQQFDAFYTSPLGRARETAEIIAETVGLIPTPLDDLREMDFGWLEGTRYFSLDGVPPLVRLLRAARFAAIVQFSGEGRAPFGRRAAGAAREIARRHPDQRVLAVVHMGVRNNILAYLVDGDPSAWRKYSGWPTCAFTELDISPAGPSRVLRLLVDEHLKS